MKKLCIAAAILLVAGIALCIFAAALDGFQEEGLLNQQYSEKTIEIREDFSHIQIDTDTTDVVFSLSEDGSCRILCRETAQQFHTAEVKEGVLSLKQQDARKWYHHIGFNFGTPTMEIYLPKTVYENLAVNGSTGNVTVPKELYFTEAKIVVSTGKILVSGTNCESLDVKTSTGEIRILDVNCKNLTAKSSTGRHLLENVQAVENIQLTSSTGNIHFTRGSCQNLTTESTTGRQTMEYVVASGDVSMESGTGDITLSAFDGETIAITTDTGDVTGTILSEKIFFTETDTGRVEVPHCMSGGSCQISTDTGDIIIKFVQ